MQFSSMIYYAAEEGGELIIDIVRLGPSDEESSVAYSTEPSEHGGRKFVATKGIASFAPGETIVYIPVKIIDDHRFESTVEFRMKLSAPEKCELGLYLHQCRVKIIDDDIFPSNKYAADLLTNPRNVLLDVHLTWWGGVGSVGSVRLFCKVQPAVSRRLTGFAIKSSFCSIFQDLPD